VLTKGTANQVLTSDGTDLSWADASGGGKTLATGLTAGTTQTMAGALALTNDINIVTVVGTDHDGVALPTAAAGKEVQIMNLDAAQKLRIWPGNGFSDTIEGGSANAYHTDGHMEPGSSRTYVADGATNWVTQRTNNDGRPKLGTAGHTYVSLRRTATTNETGDGTAYQMVWDVEQADKLGDWATPTFTCRTTGQHRVMMSLLLYSLEAATTSLSCEIEATGQDYLVDAINNDWEAEGQFHINFCTDIYMTAGNTFVITVKVQGGTKVVDVDGGAKYARMSIEYIGA